MVFLAYKWSYVIFFSGSLLLLELSVNFLSWPTRLFMILFPHTSPVHRCVFLLTCALFILTSHSGLGVSAPALPSAWNTFHCLVFWLTPATPQVSWGYRPVLRCCFLCKDFGDLWEAYPTPPNQSLMPPVCSQSTLCSVLFNIDHSGVKLT